MNKQIFSFLLLCIVILQPAAYSEPSSYAVIGAEGIGILQLWLPESQIVPISPGGEEVLVQRRFAALIFTEGREGGLDLEAIRATGTPIISIRRHMSLANLKANVQQLAALSDNGAHGQRWLTEFEAGIANLQKAAHNRPPRRILVLSPEGYTQGTGALITELIEIVGGINVAAAAGIPDAREIDDSQLSQLAPQVVLLLNWQAEAADAFRRNPRYMAISAFASGRIYRMATPGRDPATVLDELQLLACFVQSCEF